MKPSIDLTDGGYGSRKLTMAYVVMILIFGGAVLAANWAAFMPLYSTMIGGILAASGIYTGSEVSTHFINHKHVVAMAAASDDSDQAPSKESESEEEEDLEMGPLGPSRQIEDA